MSKRSAYLIAVVLGSLFLPIPTQAWDGGGGGTVHAFFTGGAGEPCCGAAINDLIRLQPDDRQAAALKLYKTLAALSEDRLAFLKAMDDQVCEHTECADMDPQFVRRLVSLASDKQQADRSNRIAWFGLAVATLSTMIALASLLLSVISHRRSRRLKR